MFSIRHAALQVISDAVCSCVYQRVEINPALCLAFVTNRNKLRMEEAAEIVSDFRNSIDELFDSGQILVFEAKGPGCIVKNKAISEDLETLLPEAFVFFHQIVDELELEAKLILSQILLS